MITRQSSGPRYSNCYLLDQAYGLNGNKYINEKKESSRQSDIFTHYLRLGVKACGAEIRKLNYKVSNMMQISKSSTVE